MVYLFAFTRRIHVAGVGDIISLLDDSFDDEVVYVGTVYLNVKKEEVKEERDAAAEVTTTTIKREDEVKVEIKPEQNDD